jgi:hypothetical protein
MSAIYTKREKIKANKCTRSSLIAGGEKSLFFEGGGGGGTVFRQIYIADPSV